MSGHPWIVTEVDMQRKWHFGKDNKFRCYCCNYKFEIGDRVRWIVGDPHTDENGKVWDTHVIACDNCSGVDA